MSEPPLSYDRVTFAYGRAPILSDVTLTIEPGQFVAIVGANGSGKTTLLRLGLGLLRPTAGSVQLFGTPVSQFRTWSRIGYVPQRAGTDAAVPISVDEIVRSGLAGRLRPFGRPTPTERRRIDHVLDLLGLHDIRARPSSQLSGGQQQRALIARALVTRPDLLVLDEPTTGVDQAARSVLRETVEHLVAVEGVAVAYISHDPEGFAGLADQVVHVSGGRVAPLDPDAHSVEA